MGRIGSDCPRSSCNKQKHRYLLRAISHGHESLLAVDWNYGLSLTTAAGAWEQGDRSNYNIKMALLGVLLEGAKERAQVRGDIETLCLLLSIGKDVTTSYVNVAPNNQQINQRLVEMNNDLNRCLSMLQKTAFKP
jgi:hypothetical protein